MNRPKIAIIDANTLAVLGLKQILQNVVPIMTVDTYGSFTELQANTPEQYAHYFVAMDIVLTHRPFFTDHRHKTIVLTLSLTDTSQLSDFHSLCINQPEPQLIRQLLMLAQHAWPSTPMVADAICRLCLKCCNRRFLPTVRLKSCRLSYRDISTRRLQTT